MAILLPMILFTAIVFFLLKKLMKPVWFVMKYVVLVLVIAMCFIILSMRNGFF